MNDLFRKTYSEWSLNCGEEMKGPQYMLGIVKQLRNDHLEKLRVKI